MGRQKYIQNLFFNKYGGHSTLSLFCSFSIILDFKRRHEPQYVTVPCVAFFRVSITEKVIVDNFMVCRDGEVG